MLSSKSWGQITIAQGLSEHWSAGGEQLIFHHLFFFALFYLFFSLLPIKLPLSQCRSFRTFTFLILSLSPGSSWTGTGCPLGLTPNSWAVSFFIWIWLSPQISLTSLHRDKTLAWLHQGQRYNGSIPEVCVETVQSHPKLWLNRFSPSTTWSKMEPSDGRKGKPHSPFPVGVSKQGNPK